MKTLTTLFALTILCATGYGQTIKALGYNTTNGQVVANTGTNVLTFTNLGARFDNTLSVGVLVVNGTNIFETGIAFGGGFFVDDNDTNNTNAVFIFQGDAEDQLRANARRDLGLGSASEVEFARIQTASLSFMADADVVEITKPLWFGDSGTNNIFEFEISEVDQAKARDNLGLGAGLTTNIIAGTNVLYFTNGILVQIEQ
jgi:hypothetical protein